MVLTKAHLRLLRYDGDVYDVEINFIPRDAESRRGKLIGALHDFANRMSEAHGVDRYYGGMEPAADEDMRFFTGTERGPIVRLR